MCIEPLGGHNITVLFSMPQIKSSKEMSFNSVRQCATLYSTCGSFTAVIIAFSFRFDKFILA